MKCPRAMSWKWLMKSRLIAAPPAAPTTGTASAATFSETTAPNREAICATSLTSAGAPSSTNPFSVMNCAASETAFARTPRTAK